MHPGLLVGSLLLGLALASGAETAPGAGSVLTDGDFETEGLQVVPPAQKGPWMGYLHGQSDAAFTLVEGEGRGGSRAVRFQRTTPGSDNAHLDQILTVQPGTVYQVSAWVRSDGHLQPLFAVMTMDWRPLVTVIAPTSKEWSQIRFSFNTYDSKQVRLEWFGGAEGKLYTGAPGTTYLDNVSVVPVASPPEALLRAFDLLRPKTGEEIAPKTMGVQPVGRHQAPRPISCRKGALVYDDGTEVALWGVNFQTALSWEYSGRLKSVGIPLEAEALKRVADTNLAELPPMGAGVIRMHLLPADFSDAEGNLKDSVFLDVLDYTLAGCRKRGIYVYLTLVNEMGASFLPDSFLAGRDRKEWIADPALSAKIARYMQGLLSHVNRYSGLRYADDETIAVVEIANEPGYVDYPTMVSDDRYAPLRAAFDKWCKDKGIETDREVCYATFRYEWVSRFLAQMCTAIRDTGCQKPVAWNLNWPRMIQGHEEVYQAVAESPVDVVSFCLYPGQSDVASPFWDHPVDLSGKNYLPYLREHWQDYSRLRWLLGTRFANKAKAVYEFETFYNQTSYLYPAMARLFRALGAQVANMWTYSLTPSAEYLRGSHYLNLYCTPEKAVSFAIASELFAETPRYTPYEAVGDDNLTFGNCVVSFEHNLSALQTPELLMYSRGWQDWQPFAASPKVKRIVGCGSSPVVTYGGTGAYFVEVGSDQIHVTLNPDATFVQPPWDRQRTRPWTLTCRLDRDTPHALTLRLAGWEGEVTVWRLDDGRETRIESRGPGMTFDALPGEYRVTKGTPRP
ncbi:MAG: carbohydrate binding domain-containing protein [Armatimonadia bacterium]